MVTLDEAKLYLRLDGNDEDDFIIGLIETAKALCMDIARLSEDEFIENKATTRIAVLYAVAYLYEHRDEANNDALVSMLKALLFGVRKAAF